MKQINRMFMMNGINVEKVEGGWITTVTFHDNKGQEQIKKRVAKNRDGMLGDVEDLSFDYTESIKDKLEANS